MRLKAQPSPCFQTNEKFECLDRRIQSWTAGLARTPFGKEIFHFHVDFGEKLGISHNFA